ncbi:MAG: HAD hydrolase-like protein [Alphaproteobacteria bacterium]|nr:HAD hydrolase-like protein [Alphaproteobacteria bacterium]
MSVPPEPQGARPVPPLRRPRAILFDWDNTLVDSWGTIHEALNYLMAAMEKPIWSLADTKERVRLSLRESFPMHFGERWEEARDIYLGRFRQIHLDRLTPLPGREAMLRTLADEGIFLGVVSNKTGELLRLEVARLGWTALFGAVVGAGDCAADKPACDPVHFALAKSGIAAGPEVWFVGDTGVDLECAYNAGCTAVLLGVDAGGEEFSRFVPHLAAEDEAGLIRAVRDL